MQDQLPANEGDIIVDLPKPFWHILGREQPPRAYWDFPEPAQLVVVAASGCGCLLVRSRKYTRRRLLADGVYTCSVCEQKKGRNVQECHMLDEVKKVVQSRDEGYVICVQVPLAGTRCDVVLLPLHATSVSQLLVLELDGVDHEHKPRQYGMSLDESFNASVDRDNMKARLVRDTGMQFARIGWSDMNAECPVWVTHLHALLDRHVMMV